MKIRESCLQTGNFIYKPGISLTKQDFHLQRESLGLQRGFSGYYLPYKTNGGVLETIITNIDIHTKERKSNGCGYKTEHVGLGLRGVSKEQLEKGDRVIVKNANMYGM